MSEKRGRPRRRYAIRRIRLVNFHNFVDEIIEAFRGRFDVTVENVTTTEERIVFNVPRELREPSPA